MHECNLSTHQTSDSQCPRLLFIKQPLYILVVCLHPLSITFRHPLSQSHCYTFHAYLMEFIFSWISKVFSMNTVAIRAPLSLPCRSTVVAKNQHTVMPVLACSYSIDSVHLHLCSPQGHDQLQILLSVHRRSMLHITIQTALSISQGWYKLWGRKVMTLLH